MQIAQIYGVLGLSSEGHFGEALHFFIYDTVKILILLLLIIWIMGLVNAYFPVEQLRNYLSQNKRFQACFLPFRVRIEDK